MREAVIVTYPQPSPNPRTRRASAAVLAIATAALLLLGCHHALADPPPPVAYGPMTELGTLNDPRINESSGIAASRTAPGLLWTHNDSGDGPNLFRLDPSNPQAVQAFKLNLPKPRDWEDMASFTLDDQPMLLVGDTGDNGRNRPYLTLWLVPEPAPDANPAWPIKPTQEIRLTFADAKHDCESIAFDPVRREIVLITKVDIRHFQPGTAGVYVLPLPDPSINPNTVHQLDRVADLSLKITTAMDISPDGQRAVVATYGDAYAYERDPHETWATAFARPPHPIALGPRGQSEAIAYGPDGQTLYLTAEKVGKPVWIVKPQP